MLTTLLPPTSGTARVGGYDVVREGPKVRRGDRRRAPGGGARPAPHRPRPPAAPDDAARRPARTSARSRADELLERVGLTEAADRKVQRLLGRDEAAARPRAGARAPAAHPLPRRADDRARPAEPEGPLGRGRPARARRRRHRLPHDAVPRGGRRPRRPRRDHRPRADRRRGHAGRAQGGDRPPDGRGRCRPTRRDRERLAGALAVFGELVSRSRARASPCGCATARAASPTSCARSTPRASAVENLRCTRRRSTTSSSPRRAARSRARPRSEETEA